MTRPLTLDLAHAIAARLCAARDCDLVLPGDLRRDAVVYALAATHALSGSGWDAKHAREHVSVTLPAFGPLLGQLLQLVPLTLAHALAQVAQRQSRTTIYISPAAVASPETLLATIAHELGHVDQIARGGLVWCVAYGLVPEVRAGAEAPCYGQDVAVAHALEGGGDLAAHDLCAVAYHSLASYGLDADAQALAVGQLAVIGRTLCHGGGIPGPCADVIRECRAEGVL
jgi:hypothetical protein